MGMMIPENPVVGGTFLRRAAIQSPNFVTGVSGWTVNQDGSAEFNNVTIRGTLKGTSYIINASGAFFYSAAPGPTTLIASITPTTTGVDPFGTATDPGFVSYGSSSGANGPRTRIDTGLGIVFVDPANMITAAEINYATVLTTSDALQLTSPQKLITDKQAVVALVRAPAAGTARVQIANASLHLKTSVTPAAPTSGTQVYVDAAGKLAMIPQAGGAMQVSGAQLADFTQFTVTQNTLQDITKAWSIPAGDAEVGSVYELTVSGSGSSPAAATTLQFAGLVGATAGSTVTFGGGAFPSAVDPFRFKVTYTIMITATGAGGTFDNEIQPVVSETGNLIPGNTANFTMDGTGSNTAALAIDTTVANVFKIQAAWGAVVAGGLTARRSTFRRIA